ncbi:MAG: hypothetical protein KAW52_08080 [candidate division Zixibacteria bacterium]|nr:hypothetical protein [candidate division Zixibacteria bacterium]
MRKVMVGLISLGLILSVTSPCFAKKKKTGEVKKNVYTDSKFGFQITALSNWKVKTEKEPSLLRVLMTQKNYKISRIAGATRYSTTIPSILVLADTTSLSLAEVESCLFQEGKKLKNKDAYMMKLDLIHNSEYLGKGNVLIDSLPARMYTLQQKYKKTVEDMREWNSPMGSTVIIEDFLAGHVILFKKENNIYVVQFSCEREFFAPTNEEFQKIIESWEFTK